MEDITFLALPALTGSILMMQLAAASNKKTKEKKK
jgi:hypothetical protein